jgi:hypothetical protein
VTLKFFGAAGLPSIGCSGSEGSGYTTSGEPPAFGSRTRFVSRDSGVELSVAERKGLCSSISGAGSSAAGWLESEVLEFEVWEEVGSGDEGDP